MFVSGLPESAVIKKGPPNGGPFIFCKTDINICNVPVCKVRSPEYRYIVTVPV